MCLSQKHKCQNNENQHYQHLLHFGSRSTNNAERNYSATELEALAICYALWKFDHILMGRQIRPYSDHIPLTYLYLLSTSPNRRLMKFISVCLEFNIMIFYRKGIHNAVAHALSRIPSDELPFQPSTEFDQQGFNVEDFDQAINLMMNELPLEPKGINVPDIEAEMLTDILNVQNYDQLSNALKHMLGGHVCQWTTISELQ